MTNANQHTSPAPSEAATRRRVLLGGGLAAMATGTGLAATSRAQAAAATDPWLLGGNTGVTVANYLGTRNVAPLIFKTAATNNSPLERMRITPAGLVGLGIASPAAKLDVNQLTGTTIRASANSVSATNIAVQGVTRNGTGVVGQHTGTTGAAPGVLGETSSRSANAAGVVGRVNPTNPGAAAGVHGVNNGTGPSGVGVWGTHAGSGYGVLGTAVSGIGVVAQGRTGVDATGNRDGVVGRVPNDSASPGVGVLGTSPDTGVRGEGDTGVHGQGGTRGVWGSSDTIGVLGSGAGHGVHGDGDTTGVYGSGPTGVLGEGSDIGLQGNGNKGVKGVGGIGVEGLGTLFGVFAKVTANGTVGLVTAALWADATGTTSTFAGYFKGRVHVDGTLTKQAGSFKIDHPLDPERKWLSHSFVESPDMMNVYNGNVILGADGTAVVDLPDYFAVLNRDYRYQLTCIGAHAPLYVAAKVKDNRFTIAGGPPGLEVSWQVTGIRQDDYAKEHPIVVEEPKSKVERGTRSFVPPGSSAKKFDPLASLDPA